MAYTIRPYEEDEKVKNAYADLSSHLANKPQEYKSGFSTQLDDIMGKIQNRQKFQYDMNADALYNQYKNQYISGGKLAMQDTMGQAAALTGGYGNSYAQMAGQQAYQGYLNGLNDKIPELYSLAMDAYNREGQDMLNQYALLADREGQDYSRYQDSLDRYNTDLNYLTNVYNNERDNDFDRYMSLINNEKWQAEFDEDQRRYNQEWAYKTAPSGSSGGGGVRRTSTTDTPSINPDADVSKAELKSAYESLVMNGGSKNGVTADALLDQAVSDGAITPAYADYLKNNVKLNEIRNTSAAGGGGKKVNTRL